MNERYTNADADFGRMAAIELTGLLLRIEDRVVFRAEDRAALRDWIGDHVARRLVILLDLDNIEAGRRHLDECRRGWRGDNFRPTDGPS